MSCYSTVFDKYQARAYNAQIIRAMRMQREHN